MSRTAASHTRSLTDRSDDRTKLAVVPGNVALQSREPSSDLCVRYGHAAQSHKHPNHEHAHLDGSEAVQDRGSHDRPVLGECPRENGRKFEVSEVVTSCDHLGSFGLCELESKVRRTSLPQRALNG